jgi:O-antigen ligase
MIGGSLLLLILVFSVLTDQFQTQLVHTVFRSAACIFCAILLAIGIHKRRLHANWLVLAILLPAAWGVIQLAVGSTIWRFATWKATLQWFSYAALFFAALQIGVLRSYLRVAVWFGGAFSICALARYLTWDRPGEPVMATFLNHNHFAAFIELLFPIALWRLFRDKSSRILVICALAMLISVVASGSRAGIALLLAELIYLGLRAYKRPLFIIAGTILLSALAVGFTWPRFEKLASSEPYESRGATARASFRMFEDRPVMGYGLGTWANVYPAYAESDTGFRLIHADDDWLEWTAEGGVPFLVIMLTIAAFAIRAAWREPWCAGCVAVLLHSFTEFPMQKQPLWAWLVVLLAIAQPRLNSESARLKQES